MSSESVSATSSAAAADSRVAVELARKQLDHVEALVAARKADLAETKQEVEIASQVAAMSGALKATLAETQARLDEFSALSNEEKLRRKQEFEQFESAPLDAQLAALDELLTTASSRRWRRGRHVTHFLFSFLLQRELPLS
jgi:hypothetical protein